ncbi:L,D-transpeptidase [Williamsia sp. CHRR-6]|uniref:L,D-transpeptidase n=1 Tax=Williamsia sp. CHRR-6 TaxID=2835871 RepID=UPI0027DC3DE6|nr:L,D-transpeptidase [Williamsia sp. CHRR-6]
MSGAVVLGVAPAVADAAPTAPPPTVPGLPGVPLPDFLRPLFPAPIKPAPTPAPKPPAPAPAPDPAQPAPPVATKTGWVALADDASHQLTVWHNGKVVRTMPISMGSSNHPTPNGVYFTKEKYRDMYMDSSTYGVPIDSPGGYRTYVEYAIRMSWDGIFLHGAPWSVEQQGRSNVSHGCINVNLDNARWAYENFPSGTPIVVRGTIGGQYVPGS